MNDVSDVPHRLRAAAADIHRWTPLHFAAQEALTADRHSVRLSKNFAATAYSGLWSPTSPIRLCAVSHLVDADGATQNVEFWSEYSIDPTAAHGQALEIA
ncbi:hypothetical protein ACFWBG_17140 [Nocardia salmonicida]|uniref:hypothetical protein n=1 Tax=Nocardia salmonicida TaxID=53431 RepID=UPI0036706730